MVVRGALLHFVINFNSLWENECNILYICIILFFYVLFLYKMYENLILVYNWCIFTMMNKIKFSLFIFWYCHLCMAMASKYSDLEAHLGKLDLHLKFVLSGMKWPHPTIQLHFQLMLCTYNHTNCNVNKFPKTLTFIYTWHVHSNWLNMSMLAFGIVWR
jgi:hypothetical protein